MRTTYAILAAALTALLLAAGLAQAQSETSDGETPVACNQVVTGTVKLANDLVCPDTDGLIVGADNTVIDLNGHTISCKGNGYAGSCQGATAAGLVSENDPEFENGVEIIEFDNVHVFTSRPGGTIEGFDNGVRIRDSENVKVEFLTITGPPLRTPLVNTRPASHGVLINGAECGGQIHVGTGESQGNDISNHNQGIAANGDCVQIVHNRIHDINGGNPAARAGIPTVMVPSNGILINQGSKNRVRGNEVLRVGDEDETIDAGVRIRREQSSENLVTNNVVNDNLGDGILITEGARNNYIVNNTMLRNGLIATGTAFYDAAGRGAPGGPPDTEDPVLNRWNQNNTCLTQNEEVPPGTCGADEGS